MGPFDNVQKDILVETILGRWEAYSAQKAQEIANLPPDQRQAALDAMKREFINIIVDEILKALKFAWATWAPASQMTVVTTSGSGKAFVLTP